MEEAHTTQPHINRFRLRQSVPTTSRIFEVIKNIIKSVIETNPRSIPLSPRTRRSANVQSGEIRRVNHLNVSYLPVYVYRDGFKIKVIENTRIIHLTILMNCMVECGVSLIDQKGKEIVSVIKLPPGEDQLVEMDIELPSNGKIFKVALQLSTAENISLVIALSIQLVKNVPELHLGQQYAIMSRRAFSLNEIFDQPTESGDNRECVICLTDDRNTIVLPCRHMCICLTCAMTLSDEHGACPICRQQLAGLIVLRKSMNWETDKSEPIITELIE